MLFLIIIPMLLMIMMFLRTINYGGIAGQFRLNFPPPPPPSGMRVAPFSFSVVKKKKT
jgi:hypothetical protein